MAEAAAATKKDQPDAAGRADGTDARGARGRALADGPRALPRPARSSSGSTAAASTDFAAMTDLPRGAARRRWPSASASRRRPIARRDVSEDGTEKFLLTLQDGRHDRVGLHPATRRNQTFCVSTQVGCAMGCALLPDGDDGAGAQPDAGRDRRPGARARRGARPARRRASTSSSWAWASRCTTTTRTMAALRILADDHGFAMPPAAHHAVDGGARAGHRAARGRRRDAATWPCRCTRRPTSSARRSCR